MWTKFKWNDVFTALCLLAIESYSSSTKAQCAIAHFLWMKRGTRELGRRLEGGREEGRPRSSWKKMRVVKVGRSRSEGGREKVGLIPLHEGWEIFIFVTKHRRECHELLVKKLGISMDVGPNLIKRMKKLYF